MKTDREKYIDSFIDSIITQEDYENNKNTQIDEITKKYMKELDKYIYVEPEDIFSLKPGGYIRYVTKDYNLCWGGILVKVNKTINGTFMLLKNIDKQYLKLQYEKHFIFYKSHQTYGDKVRDLFISYLDKLPDDDI